MNSITFILTKPQVTQRGLVFLLVNGKTTNCVTKNINDELTFREPWEQIERRIPHWRADIGGEFDYMYGIANEN